MNQRTLSQLKVRLHGENANVNVISFSDGLLENLIRCSTIKRNYNFRFRFHLNVQT